MRIIAFTQDERFLAVVREKYKNIAKPNERKVHVLAFYNLEQMEAIVKRPDKLKSVPYIASSIDQVPEQNKSLVFNMANITDWDVEFLVIVSTANPPNTAAMRLRYE